MKILTILLPLLLLTACDNKFQVETPIPPTEEIPIPVEPEEPPVIAKVYCQDFNSLNRGSEIPCSCPADYILTEDTKMCVDKANFAQISIRTQDEAVVGRDTWVRAEIKINADLVNPEWTATHAGRVRGRGNSTWELPKKPYRFKLDSSAEVMGLPKDKDWVLLANYSDKTLLRVLLAFEMGKRLGMEYTPRYKIVEFFLNGSYKGVYLLTEQVKVAKNRVNVGDDGFLVELDQRAVDTDDTYFLAVGGTPFVIKEPEPISPTQFDYISNHFRDVNNVLKSSTMADPDIGYQSVINTESFVDWYFVNEILKNSDSANYSSVFYHKKLDGKLAMGPIWDFDISAGNNHFLEVVNPDGWYIRTKATWFTYLFNDPAFENRIRDKWNTFPERGLDYSSLASFIDQKALAIQSAQIRNFNVWNILNIYVWPNAVVTGSYQGEVDYLKTWLHDRMEWIDSQLNP